MSSAKMKTMCGRLAAIFSSALADTGRRQPIACRTRGNAVVGRAVFIIPPA